MAHELMFNDDGKAAMFYVGDTPWHEEGQELMHPPTAADAIRFANLDWDVEKATLRYQTAEASDDVPNCVALVPGKGWKKEKRPVFGIVSDKFNILQNKDAFAFFDPVVKRGFAEYETAGALGDGSRIWVLAKLKESFEIGRNDTIERYLLLSNNHDGHGTVTVKFTPIRVVCQNTLSMALHDVREFFSIRHDRSLFENLVCTADDMCDRIEARYGQIRRHFWEMQQVRVIPDQAQAYFAVVYADPDLPAPRNAQQERQQEKRLQMLARKRANCMNILKNSPRCRLDNGENTVWSIYNAVTEHEDHWLPAGSRRRSRSNRLQSIWFGDGQQRKLKAFNEAMRLVQEKPAGRA